jgi:hypothetical protein
VFVSLAVALTNTAFGADEMDGSAVVDVPDGSGARLDVGVGTQYDSNVFFVKGDEISSASAIAQLETGYRWQGDLTGLDLALDGRYQQYSENSLTAASSIGVSMMLDREHEFGNTRASVSYSDASSLIDSFDNNGKFVGDQRQHTASAAVQRLFEISETNSIVASLDGSRVKFVDTPAGVRQDDYDFATGATRWEWQYGERVTFGAGVVGSWYNSDGRNFTNEVTTVGPALSMRYEIGESITGSVEASYRRSDTKLVYFGSIEQHDAGANYYGRAGIAKQFERGSLSLDVSRNIQPNSNGRQNIRDEITAGFGRELSERTTLRSWVTALKEEPENQGSVGAANDRRTAFAGEFDVDYAFAERLTGSVGYRYQWQDTDAPDTDVSGQTVMMTLRWVMGGTSS